jgi:hypothetical protein
LKNIIAYIRRNWAPFGRPAEAEAEGMGGAISQQKSEILIKNI